MKDKLGFESFFKPTDSRYTHKLKERCVAALRLLARGKVKDEWNDVIAGNIVALMETRANRGAIGSLGLAPQKRKAFIKTQEAWLGAALLEAAEQGTLSEVAKLLDRRRTGRAILNVDHYKVIVAYMSILALKDRPPLIGELLEQRQIDKPKRTKDNIEEWMRANSQEHVIRDILKRYDLPLSKGQRGRRW